MVHAVKEVFERFVFDPSLIDLVVWYPYLSWHDFMISLATVVAWRMISDRMSRFASFHIRRTAANGLLRIALMVRPDGPYVPPRPRRPSAGPRARNQRPRVSVQRGYPGAAYA